MREIKFRAWDKEKKVMSIVRSWDFAHGNIELGKELQPEADKFEEEVELMQFTGLKDKNGVETYEGDILKGGYKVEYRYDCFVVEYEKDDFSSIMWVSNKIGGVEVIGNIYQNPELLN